MQLTAFAVRWLVVGTTLATTSTIAQADGTISFRGAYYKERATRVVQPMFDANLDVGEAGTLQLHSLVDAITSASAAAGAADNAFTERRTEVGGNYLHALGRFRMGGGGRFSVEPDYQSSFLNLRGEVDLAEKNTTIALNLARGSDRIDNSGSQGGLSSPLSGSLSTSLASLSVSQLLSPVSLVSLSYDLMYLDGFQENIYRTVIAGGMVQRERVPEVRIRQAIAASARYYLELTNTALIAAYRYYRDDWKIQGHAPEARIVQHLADDDIELHLSYRYYRQSEAFFFEEVYDSADPMDEPYLTDDPKLSAVRTHLAGFKAAVYLRQFGMSGSYKDVRLEVLAQYLAQNTRFGNAFISQFAMTFPLEY